MCTHRKIKKKKKNRKKSGKAAKHGSGILNKLIDKLPFELHLPKYNYCGPGIIYSHFSV